MRPDSDIDVMVTFASDARISLYDLVDVHDELAAIFGRDVDVVEKAAVVNPYRRRSIERDLTVLYAA